eukprot:433330-Pleurochrysis_carterae.AAC.1
MRRKAAAEGRLPLSCVANGLAPTCAGSLPGHCSRGARTERLQRTRTTTSLLSVVFLYGPTRTRAVGMLDG